MKQIKKRTETFFEAEMKDVFDRFRTLKERNQEIDEDKKYLLQSLNLQEGELPPCYAEKDAVFTLANPFQEREREIRRREAAAAPMTKAEARELDKYKSFFHSNKISYLMRENVLLQEPHENRILRYHGNTREVERLAITKKGMIETD
jgi:hypothetical protein